MRARESSVRLHAQSEFRNKLIQLSLHSRTDQISIVLHNEALTWQTAFSSSAASLRSTANGRRHTEQLPECFIE